MERAQLLIWVDSGPLGKQGGISKAFKDATKSVKPHGKIVIPRDEITDSVKGNMICDGFLDRSITRGQLMPVK
ncbi:hypothetical protein C7120_09980 [Prevotella sp. oral taxon 376]|nr:hypothetical protein C7120_09980 [Prevotella sp. oral taxon 376]